MASESDRARTNGALALALCVIGGVLVRRSPVVGAALIFCGLICTYLAITARRRE
jgi:hypothetical protein